jgi:hypothetical protein
MALLAMMGAPLPCNLIDRRCLTAEVLFYDWSPRNSFPVDSVVMARVSVNIDPRAKVSTPYSVDYPDLL